VELRVKSGLIFRIFNLKYNLRFGHPRTDVCFKCLELTAKIQKETDPVKTSFLIAAKRVHILRAKAFLILLRSKELTSLTLSFDCQKNFPLHKLLDQMVYYSCQLYLYNFAIVEGSSTEKLSR
jgi:hypothetical protein